MEYSSDEVLLVEDNEQILKSTADSLAKIGFNVICARDGVEALSIFKDRLDKGIPIRVVVTDMLMPNMNGMNLIKEVFRSRQQTAFIVCSAYSELKEDLEKFPCIRRIHIKPLNLKDVIQDLITIFTNREWEVIPSEVQHQKIPRKAYEAIQTILKHLI